MALIVVSRPESLFAGVLERKDAPFARAQRRAGRGQHLAQLAEMNQRVRGSYDIERVPR